LWNTKRPPQLRSPGIPDRVVSLSTRDSINGIIQSWNAGAQRIFGYSAEEVIGQPINLLVPPERIEEEEQIIECLRRGERVEHLETVRVIKDGRRIDVSVTTSPIKDRAGRIVGASKIARDLSDRKRAEEALQAALGLMQRVG
jgi:PAS domain S-box-containing protein